MYLFSFALLEPQVEMDILGGTVSDLQSGKEENVKIGEPFIYK